LPVVLILAFLQCPNLNTTDGEVSRSVGPAIRDVERGALASVEKEAKYRGRPVDAIDGSLESGGGGANHRDVVSVVSSPEAGVEELESSISFRLGAAHQGLSSKIENDGTKPIALTHPRGRLHLHDLLANNKVELVVPIDVS
jgi:hypothetical protein